MSTRTMSTLVGACALALTLAASAAAAQAPEAPASDPPPTEGATAPGETWTGQADAPADDSEAGWARPGYERVRVLRSERALTTPRRTFDVYVSAEVGTRSRTQESFFRVPALERDAPPRLTLRYGTAYGITDDLEVSAAFPPLIFIDGVVFDGPVGAVTWRFLRLDGLELGVEGHGVIPMANDLGLGLRVPLLLRLGPNLRLDVAPDVSVVTTDGQVYGTGELPVTLTVQVARTFAVLVGAGVSTLGFENVAMSASGALALTFAGDHGAVADLLLRVALPSLIDGSGRGVEAATDHWVVSLGARFYVRLPQDRGDRGEKL